MDVHRARVGGGRGPPGVDGPEEPAGLAVDDRDLGADAAPDVERTVRIGFGRDEPSVCTTSDQALRREFGQDFGGAEVRHLGVGQRQLQCRAQQLRSEHVRVRGVGDGRLDRAVEQRGRVMHEIGVEWVVARDEHHEGALTAASGAPGLLPERCDGSREPGHHHCVEPAMSTPSSRALVVATPRSRPSARADSRSRRSSARYPAR